MLSSVYFGCGEMGDECYATAGLNNYARFGLGYSHSGSLAESTEVAMIHWSTRVGLALDYGLRSRRSMSSES